MFSFCSHLSILAQMVTERFGHLTRSPTSHICWLLTEPFGQNVEANDVRIPRTFRADVFGRNRERLGGLSGQPRTRPMGNPYEKSKSFPSRCFAWRPLERQTRGRRHDDIRRRSPTGLAGYKYGSGDSCLPASYQLSHMKA